MPPPSMLGPRRHARHSRAYSPSALAGIQAGAGRKALALTFMRSQAARSPPYDPPKATTGESGAPASLLMYCTHAADQLFRSNRRGLILDVAAQASQKRPWL